MGLDYNTARWLMRALDWKGKEVLTVGRQNWWLSTREARLLGTGFVPDYSPATYSDGFWKAIGCKVTSVDLVADEQPDIILDLSVPSNVLYHLMTSLYDVVIDLGTAEHIADQQAYWRNLHHALRTGGSLLGILPADGLCGHGLYQYSPEFFSNMSGYLTVSVGWFVYGPKIRYIPFANNGRHERNFMWPTYVAFHLKKFANFGLPIQYMSATTPTTKPRTSKLAGKLLNIPGVRMAERIVRGLKALQYFTK
jgi:SAM-dependent methyltransferase